VSETIQEIIVGTDLSAYDNEIVLTRSKLLDSFGSLADSNMQILLDRSDFQRFSTILHREMTMTIRYNKFWSLEECSRYDSFLSKCELPPSFVSVWGGRKGPADPVSSGWQPFSSITGLNTPTSLVIMSDNYGVPMTDINGGIIYVMDSVNNSIRAVMKPNQIRTLVGGAIDGAKGTPIALGDAATVSLSSPRSGTFFNIKTQSKMYYLLVFVETTSHSVKAMLVHESDNEDTKIRGAAKGEVQFTKDEIVLIAGKRGCGHSDGTDAKFNYPTGICAFGNALYVCCRGNHTLRSITLKKVSLVMSREFCRSNLSFV
jgi:hypothetical protein